MRLGKALAQVAELPRPESFDGFLRRIDPSWIQEGLRVTGTATVRRRRLPAEQVVWLVLGMAMFRDRSIVEVVDSLDLVLPGKQKSEIAPSSVVKARKRLGAEPLRWIFDTSASQWAHASAAEDRWQGLALYGADGTTLRVHDSQENRDHFGAPRYGGGEGSYPQVRLVGLFALRSHLLVAASFGPYTSGENTYARNLWMNLPNHSLCIVDRNFLAADVLIPIARDGTERHWLIRAKSNTRWRVIKRLGRDDHLVEMTVSRDARRRDPSLPPTWVVRAVRYQIPGFPPQWLLTSLLDAKRYPARELAALYHERWEIELAYDEIKTEMLDREETIRCKSPEAVAQEIWGILLAYNLVRLEMKRVADEVGVPPTRISFVTSMILISDEWLWSTYAKPGAVPRHLRDLRTKLRRLVLPPRRSDRAYPRAVKIPASSYPSRRHTPKSGNAK